MAASLSIECEDDVALKEDLADRGSLVLPQLTEAEKGSPLGHSMGHVVGLFLSLKEQIMDQRAKEDKRAPKAARKDSKDAPREPSPDHQFPEAAPFPPNQLTGQHPPQESLVQGRAKIEESHKMKLDIRSQMDFQNKMRAMKEQELNKCKGNTHATDAFHQSLGFNPPPIAEAPVATGEPGVLLDSGNESFWNSDIVADNLFEFLLDE